MNTTHVLATVEAQRLQKAVEGLVSGAYCVTVTHQGADEIRGFVRNGDGVEYGVALTKDRSFCNCKDAMFRHAVCKHAVVLALYAIRNPQAEQEEKPVVYNLKLGKAKRDFTFSA